MTKLTKTCVFKIAGIYTKEVDMAIYSHITKKNYSSIKEYEKDLRKLKLNKLNEINSEIKNW